MDRARHHIPLVDSDGGATHYGLDAILGVVSENAPLLGAVGSHRYVRPALDRMYHFITYNRRHIVAAPPPVDGIDCAPDFEPTHIKNSLTFCVVVVAAAGRAAPVAVGATALASTALVATRHTSWRIEPLEAAGHAASATTASALAAAATRTVTSSAPLAVAAAAFAGARKLYLRRWMRAPRR